MRIFVTLLALLFTGISYAQVPGTFADAATPATNPMNPNGDAFITSTGAAFTQGILDETEFEIPFIPIPQYQPEPPDDNQYDPGCRFYDLVNVQAMNAASTYYYYKDSDGIPDNADDLLFFRFRVARFSNGATGFSILMDTDYTFGFSGPESDPNAVKGNPGFELEIAVYNSTGSAGGVRVFNVDGMDTASVINDYRSIHSNYQVAYALNQDPYCTTNVPAFVDLYVPFSALGISSTTQIRMAVAVNEDPKTSLGGGAHDIGGIDGKLIADDDDQFMAAILHYSPIAIGNSVNKAPVVPDFSLSIDENAPAADIVHTVGALDPNGDILTFSITSGNIDNAFALNGITGQISVNNPAALDAEIRSSFTLVVRVSDGKLYNNSIVTIKLNDINEHQPVVTDAIIDLDENTGYGSPVHTVVADDQDVTAVLAYSLLSGNSGQAFAINSETGQITVNNSAELDFETSPPYYLGVRVSDGKFTDEGLLTIRLTDVNDYPVIAAATVSLPENSVNGTAVYAVSASDEDVPAATLTYSITEGDDRLAFSIDGTGTIRVNNGSILDFENISVFQLTVRVSDGALFSDAPVTIHLVNVNEPPSATNASISIDENLPNGTVVHQVMATDPDADDVLRFSIENGNSDAGFWIDEHTGELLINHSEMVDFLLHPVFDLTILVRDRAGLAARAQYRIELINIPEKVDITPWKGFSPDGDGINDFWFIGGFDVFPENEVKVFNQWGNLVFEARNYDNQEVVWRGQNQESFVLMGEQVAGSTYFFVIKVAGLREPVTGYVIVKN